ncbi:MULTISPECIES: S-layer protein [Lysinibacillus]|nr:MULTISPECIES: S-layer protein [Lysinibacillus]AMO31367.1 S-layer protein [Lysinibacillus sphaericus]AMR89521.1 S-layer protein [Lysinibacillus sphaericus]ANA47592.1 S-layer protein [Lysinibacillus sphaericus]KZL47004.1 S-layer protein [Lysinibacillus sphaericus]MBG9710251.1 S-layer protein [Lysinibacillus sphaericus]
MTNKALSTLIATAITATLVLPVSTAQASFSLNQSNLYETQVQVAATKKMVGNAVTIKNITNDTVITSNGTFRIHKDLKPLFDHSNKTALTNALATIVVKNKQIIDVTSLTLNKAGTSKKSVYFDGGHTHISGDFTVNADYVNIQDVTVDGQLIITNRVKKAITLDDVSVSDTITLKPLIIKKNDWLYVTLRDMKSSTINLARTKVNISSDQALSKIDIIGKVPTFELKANVEKLTINVEENFNLFGEGKIEQIIVKDGTKVALNSGHQVGKVQVDNKKVSVTLPAIDKKELTTLLASPPYVQVSINGYDILTTDKWTTQVDRNIFDSAVTSARAIANNNSASQEQVKNAISQYRNALAVYQNAQKSGTKYGYGYNYGDKATLQSLINSIQYVTVSWGSDVYHNNPWTTQAERNAIDSAVSAAQAVVNNYYATQTDIASAINNLNNAIWTYKNAYKYNNNYYYGNKYNLQTLVNQAKSIYVTVSEDGADLSSNTNWTTYMEWYIFDSAVSYAETFLSNNYFSDYEVTYVINYLNNAISTYKGQYKKGKD